MKILTIFGTRPEAIKMAPVVRALAADPAFDSRVCVTAQHRRMLDQVLRLFDIHPDHDLDLMRPGQDLTDITANVLIGLRDVLNTERPDLVLVHGDTTTTSAASLAAFYQRIPVGHIEAGLRTGNIHAPWPEEMNRRLTGQIAEWHFAPTECARTNLLHEGIEPHRITVTGNTVIDALLEVVQRLRTDQDLRTEVESKFDALDSARGKRPANYRIDLTGVRSSIFKLKGSRAAMASGVLAAGRCSKRWLR